MVQCDYIRFVAPKEVVIRDVDATGPSQSIHVSVCVIVHGQGNDTSSFPDSFRNYKVDPSNFIFPVTCRKVKRHDSFPGSSSVSFLLVLRDSRISKKNSCSLFEVVKKAWIWVTRSTNSEEILSFVAEYGRSISNAGGGFVTAGYSRIKEFNGKFLEPI